MTIVLLALAAACGAFCIWLAVRIVNRRERWAMWALAATIACSGIALAVCWKDLWRGPPHKRGKIRYEFELVFDRAHARAKQSEKPILVYFCMAGSAIDFRMDYGVLEQPEIVSRLGRFECVAAYVANVPNGSGTDPDQLEQKNQKLASSLLGETACPSFVVVDAAFPVGQTPQLEMILGTSVGLTDNESFAEFLDSSLDQWAERYPRPSVMTYLLPALVVAFASFGVWLTVRFVNRRERWAKWTLVAVGLPVLYVASFGPACWISSRVGRNDNSARNGKNIVTRVFQPVLGFCWEYSETTTGEALRHYALLLSDPRWAIVYNGTVDKFQWHVIDP